MSVRLLVPVSMVVLAPTLVAQETRTPDVHFVPTPMEVVHAMLEVARVGPKDMVYDLGSGDGRIVITAASQHGARGIGIDIDPERIAESRKNADSAGVTDRVTFRQADLFKTDLSKATVVTLYLLPALNEKLRPKLYQELRPGSRIVSNAFDMGDWEHDSLVAVPGKAGGTHNVYYWLLPADVSGDWTVTVDAGESYQLSLEQRYQKVEGSAKGRSGEVGLQDVRVKGDSLEFALEAAGASAPGTLRFSGRVQGGSAKGTVGGSGGEPREWTAKRRSRGAGPVPRDTSGQS